MKVLDTFSKYCKQKEIVIWERILYNRSKENSVEVRGNLCEKKETYMVGYGCADFSEGFSAGVCGCDTDRRDQPVSGTDDPPE